jgi:hypothetical protein
MVLWVDEIIKDEAARYFAKSAKGKVSSSYPLPNVGMLVRCHTEMREGLIRGGAFLFSFQLNKKVLRREESAWASAISYSVRINFFSIPICYSRVFCHVIMFTFCTVFLFCTSSVDGSIFRLSSSSLSTTLLRL